MAIHELSKRITLARKKAGLTQIELADVLRIDKATLNRYEKGHRVPDALLVAQMVTQLGCDPEWLLTGFEPTHAAPDEVVPRRRHLESYTAVEREYIDKLTAIFEQSQIEDISYLKGVLDTLASKIKKNAKAKKGA